MHQYLDSVLEVLIRLPMWVLLQALVFQCFAILCLKWMCVGVLAYLCGVLCFHFVVAFGPPVVTVCVPLLTLANFFQFPDFGHPSAA